MSKYNLTLDSKNRISLTKLLRYTGVSSVQASVLENGDILLKPMVQIPAGEAWIYEDPKVLASIKRGLAQEGTVDRGSFTKRASE